MALTFYHLEQLISLRERDVISAPSAVAEMGSQQLANDFLRARDRIEYLGQLFGVSAKLDLPSPQPTAVLEGGEEHLPETAPFSRSFWEWLGYQYSSIDIDGSPHSIALDLNFDRAPRWARKQFGLVTNFGTSEHIANQLNVFRVIHELAAHDGLMMHFLPMQGMLNHGLVNYTPKFFWMLARSNGYQLIHMNILGPGPSYRFPKNIVDSIRPFDPAIDTQRHGLDQRDIGLNVVLKKVFDTPYVPPIDVPTGSGAGSDKMSRRYWSVFTPDAFAKTGGSLFRRMARHLVRTGARSSSRVFSDWG